MIMGNQSPGNKILEGLSNEQSFLAEALEHSGVGTFVLNEDFEVVWINRAIESFFGVKRKDLLGRDKRDLIENQIMTIFEKPDRFKKKVFHDYRTNSHVDQFECHVLPDDSREERWLLHWSTPITRGRYQNGRIEHYTDITKQKKAERKLRESERRYREIVRNCPDGIFVLDETGAFVDVNPAGTIITGYDRNELLARSIFDLAPDPDHTAGNTLQNLLRTEREHSEFPIVTKSGDQKHCIVEATKLLDERIFAFVKDISDRKEIEEALLESEKRFRLMAEQSESVIWLTDESFEELLFINARYEDVFGGSKQELLEHPVNVLNYIKPQDRRKVLKKFDRLIEGNKIELEYRVDPDSDYERWVHAWGIPVRDQGRTKYLMGSVREITDRKERESKLRKIARTDELTGLPNRKALFERLREEIPRAKRYDSPLSFTLLDIDHFKTINDQYGHQVGDRVLRRVASLLREETRSPDYPGRYGGEEFAVIYPETDQDQAVTVTERIRRKTEETVFSVGGHSIDLCLSGGVTTWSDKDQTVDDFVGRADEALYQAKREGRNQIVVE